MDLKMILLTWEGGFMTNDPEVPASNNQAADFWRYTIGVNAMPADTREKTVYINWSPWQNQPVSEEQHKEWKNNKSFDEGLAMIPGRIWRGPYEGQYLVAIDCDNKKAIDEICNSLGFKDTDELSNWTIVELHKDAPNKAHIYIRSTKPFKKKSSDKVNSESVDKIEADEIPAIEVKGLGEHGIMFCSPSIHKNGYPYQIIGTKEPALCDEFEIHIDNICKKYRILYLEQRSDNVNYQSNNNCVIPIEDLFKPNAKIYEGHNRHEALLRVAESLIQRNKNILSWEQIKKMVYDWNQGHCIPPLNDKEFERQCKDALKFTTKTNDKAIENKGNSENDDNNNNSDKIQYADTDLLEKIKEDHCKELFVDQYNSAHVSIKIDDHTEVLSLNGRRFKNLLYRIFYNETKKLNAEKIEGILNILKADAEFSGNIKKLDLRVAKTDDYTIYYDLTDKNWRVIKITTNGWSIVEGKKESPIPILFKRYSNQKPQIIPEIYDKGDIFDKFIDLLNLKDENNRLLLKCYIISLFIPSMAKPILILHGEQGSAKSTLQESIKMLVDPSIVKTLTFPRDINELVQQLSHNYIAYYDNISSIPDWISDLLCRAVTGSGFSKRQLFTDDDDFIYTFKRCVGINGINLGNIKSDLLDRSIIIQLEKIPKKKRRKIEELWKDFNMIKPQLLGYIFHVLVKMLDVKKKEGGITLPDGYNRMADFEEYGEIISRCMGNEDNKFLEAYQENVGIQIDQAIEANPLSTVLLQFMDRRDNPGNEWKGTATKLLSELNEFAENELKMIISRIKSWPKSPNKLSGDLNEIITNLREKGIVIKRDKDNKGNRIITICKLSPEPSYRQEPADQAQDSNEMFDDTKETTAKVSPKPEDENQSQKDDNGRLDDINDTLQYSKDKFENDDVNDANAELLYECYYCANFTPTTDEVKYQKHGISIHPKKRLYPTLSELKEMGIEPKGKRWEI